MGLLGRERLWESWVRRRLGGVARGFLGTPCGLGRVATVARGCYLPLPRMRVVACSLVLIANFLEGLKASWLVDYRLLWIAATLTTSIQWLSRLVNRSMLAGSHIPSPPIG